MEYYIVFGSEKREKGCLGVVFRGVFLFLGVEMGGRLNEARYILSV